MLSSWLRTSGASSPNFLVTVSGVEGPSIVNRLIDKYSVNGGNCVWDVVMFVRRGISGGIEGRRVAVVNFEKREDA